jgi:hypothetical protein
LWQKTDVFYRINESQSLDEWRYPFKKVNHTQLEWLISLHFPLLSGYMMDYYKARGHINIVNDFKLPEVENPDIVEYYTDAAQVPYSYIPLIEFNDLDLNFFFGNIEDLKMFASCVGANAIIEGTTKSSKLSSKREISNPLGVIFGGQYPIEGRVYETEDKKSYLYTLIKKDSSHQQVKDNLDKYDLLLKLAELKAKGIISEKEFQEEKKKLLEEK